VNIEFLHTLVIEELRNLFNADSQLSEILPLMERSSLSSEVRKAIRRRRELEQDQTKRIVEIMAIYESHPGGGQCHAMRGLLEEAEEVLRRESGMYPARIEPRLLAVLRKVGHLRAASLKCAIAIVHLLEADQVESTLNDCLSQEIEADEFISALGDDMLRLIVASSVDETTSALEALKKFD
jgi:ferritin-like metal-binding protein YciE